MKSMDIALVLKENYYAVTGENHGVIVVAVSKWKAINVFRKAYQGEMVLEVHEIADHLVRNL